MLKLALNKSMRPCGDEQGINKLWPKLELAMSSDFHYYESRATICESILKIHIKRSFVGNRFKQKKHLYLI